MVRKDLKAFKLGWVDQFEEVMSHNVIIIHDGKQIANVLYKSVSSTSVKFKDSADISKMHQLS